MINRIFNKPLAIAMAAATIPSVVQAEDNGFVKNANLPADVKMTCVTDHKNSKNQEVTFDDWFGGKVVANGWVEPANSEAPIFADSKNNTLCDFYRWGSQMFLWLTSGKENYHVFNVAPGFYDVSVENDNQRTFIKNDGTMSLGLRHGKTDDEIELGQAGGNDVLISQNNSLVYYSIHANDIFALYRTGIDVKNGDTTAIADFDEDQQEKLIAAAKDLPGTFPANPDENTAVVTFGELYGYDVSSPEAMAMEIKISWVNADTVQNRNDYVLTQANVPTYKNRNPKGPWDATGKTELMTLAMVGMHIVGTVNGHPEMIWTTIEHVDNVPDNSYAYTNTAGDTATQNYDSSGLWTFLPTNADMPGFIEPNAQVVVDSGSTSPAHIVANPEGATIGPVDVYRVNPWGNLPGNYEVNNNTLLASINVSVLSQLAAGDIRGNYIQTGAIWTSMGQIPPGYPDIFPTDNGNEDTYLRGSLYLANTTMETFFQYQSNVNGALFHANCFACHGEGATDPVPTNISHIFSSLQALPAK